ncbi:hypothetical protein AB0B86_12715 [Micromonospora sp. NPDC049047]|uniref:hypothetical protein n=1 Tax=Micromonospora sp. NPDC049047 TaxID=3155645 RepID=UPI0033F92728
MPDHLPGMVRSVLVTAAASGRGRALPRLPPRPRRMATLACAGRERAARATITRTPVRRAA